jgi:peptidoglycan/xylan/chitin deacetylase (PgdA/CDA1 family)
MPHRGHLFQAQKAVFFTLTVILLLATSRLGQAGDTLQSPPHDETRRRIRVPILMYHYVSVPPPDADEYRLDLSVSPPLFAAHMAWLARNGYTSITLDDLYRALTEGRPLPPRPVILTFDDGYADAYEHAFPILKQYGLTATFFVVTGWLDTRQPGYLTWDQAREMVAAGMSIQSHTRSHHDLTDGCDHDCRIYEILGSVETIAAEIGIRPRFFCYPGGRYDDAVLPMLAQVGIVAAVTTQAGTLHVSDRPLELKRARMRGTTTVDDLAWIMNDWNE